MSDLRILQSGLSGSSSDHVLMGAKCSLLTIKICGSKIKERNVIRTRNEKRAEMRLL